MELSSGELLRFLPIVDVVLVAAPEVFSPFALEEEEGVDKGSEGSSDGGGWSRISIKLLSKIGLHEEAYGMK